MERDDFCFSMRDPTKILIPIIGSDFFRPLFTELFDFKFFYDQLQDEPDRFKQEFSFNECEDDIQRIFNYCSSEKFSVGERKHISNKIALAISSILYDSHSAFFEDGINELKRLSGFLPYLCFNSHCFLSLSLYSQCEEVKSELKLNKFNSHCGQLTVLKENEMSFILSSLVVDDSSENKILSIEEAERKLISHIEAIRTITPSSKANYTFLALGLNESELKRISNLSSMLCTQYQFKLYGISIGNEPNDRLKSRFCTVNDVEDLLDLLSDIYHPYLLPLKPKDTNDTSYFYNVKDNEESLNCTHSCVKNNFSSEYSFFFDYENVLDESYESGNKTDIDCFTDFLFSPKKIKVAFICEGKSKGKSQFAKHIIEGIIQGKGEAFSWMPYYYECPSLFTGAEIIDRCEESKKVVAFIDNIPINASSCFSKIRINKGKLEIKDVGLFSRFFRKILDKNIIVRIVLIIQDDNDIFANFKAAENTNAADKKKTIEDILDESLKDILDESLKPFKFRRFENTYDKNGEPSGPLRDFFDKGSNKMKESSFFNPYLAVGLKDGILTSSSSFGEVVAGLFSIVTAGVSKENIINRKYNDLMRDAYDRADNDNEVTADEIQYFISICENINQTHSLIGEMDDIHIHSHIEEMYDTRIHSYYKVAAKDDNRERIRDEYEKISDEGNLNMPK